jgi:hypothetical protein
VSASDSPSGFYFDPEGRPIDFAEWGRHMDNRWIVDTDVAGRRITSAYLGIDQRVLAGRPVEDGEKPWIFGTLDWATDYERFDTCQEDAQRRHQAFVAWAERNTYPAN